LPRRPAQQGHGGGRQSQTKPPKLAQCRLPPLPGGSPTPCRTCSGAISGRLVEGSGPLPTCISTSHPPDATRRRPLRGLGGAGFGPDVQPGRPGRGRIPAERAGPGDSAEVMRAKRAAWAGTPGLVPESLRKHTSPTSYLEEVRRPLGTAAGAGHSGYPVERYPAGKHVRPDGASAAGDLV
jgi:hypothetical protein